jgi:glucokinase
MDIGGTRARVGLVRSDGVILCEQKLPTLSDPQAMIPRLVEAVRECSDAGDVPLEHLAGIGCSVAGTVHLKSQTIGKSPNLPRWEGFSLGEALREATRDLLPKEVPRVVDNDANAAAWGIARFEAPELRHLLYVTISTGIGGGIVIERALYHGAEGNAAEVGHTILRPGGPVCRCGKRGCWEALSSGTAIAREGRERLDIEDITTEQVSELARSGDGTAQTILDEAAFYIGVGLANLTEIFDPGAIFLGGGVMNNWAMLSKQALEAYRGQSRWQVPIRVTALGDEVGLLGAAALVFERD